MKNSIKRTLAVFAATVLASSAASVTAISAAQPGDISLAQNAYVSAAHPEDAVITFDFGEHTAHPGDEIKVQVGISAGENPIIAMDVEFAQEGGIQIVGISDSSPALGRAAIQASLELPGCNFYCADANADPLKADESRAVFTLTYRIPRNCPEGEYKIGFGDKCEVFVDNSAWTYQTKTVNGTIKVEKDPNAPDKYALGDVNNDGVVDGSDATIVLREFGNSQGPKGESFTDVEKAAGDIDGNGIIDGSDATLILKFSGQASKDSSIAEMGMEAWLKDNFPRG